MAVPNAQAKYLDVIDYVKSELNECTVYFNGACWTRPPPGKGYIVWNNARESCQNANILFPGFDLMDRGVLIVAYGLFLIWLFFGIAICSDIFAEAIENVTGQTRKVAKRDPRTGETIIVEEKVWNWVVANISLMAVGTSAPEILLSIVETLTELGSKTGQLGASTIIGSAAYNYFLIPGICCAALPPGQFKKLEHIWVFLCTAIWSVWAYIWMYIVLKISSPGVVELWEGFVTLAFFPVMLVSAYIVDKKPWTWGRGQVSSSFDLEENLEKKNGTDDQGSKDKSNGVYAPNANGSIKMPSNAGASIAPKQKHSILYYRNLTVRRLAGESKTPEMLAFAQEHPREESEFNDEVETLSGRFVERVKREQAAPAGSSKLGFSSMHYSVLEAQGVAKVVVRRYDGDLDMPLSVHYATKDGTAVAGIDYNPVQGDLKFAAGETSKEIDISIIDDDMSEPDVTFQVVLSDVKGVGVVVVQDSVPVTIVDDDDGGMIMFELPTKEVSLGEGYVELPVVRRNGTDGRVTVEFRTRDGTGPAAIAGQHYKETKGTLVFENGEDRGRLRVPLLSLGDNKMLIFKVILSNPLGGAVLGKRAICRVIIVPARLKLSKNQSLGSHKFGIGSIKGAAEDHEGGEGEEDEEPFNLWHAYLDQFKDAVLPELEGDNVWFDVLLHYTCITWKVICAFIPPLDWGASYPAFFGSLVILVGIIYLTEEVANILGCALTLSQVMTGLSIVAFGTSLPDSFASRLAAMHDDTADAAIGNITGSNSANIYLGLGLPWIVAAGYYYGRGEQYLVPPGDLGFTLVLWCAGFGANTIIFGIRRFQGGELGGSKVMQRVLMGWCVFLWVFFLVLSGVYDYNHFSSNL